MLTGFIMIVVTLVIVIAPIYVGLHFSKKSAQKRREQEEGKNR